MLLCESCAGEIKTQTAQHIPARQRCSSVRELAPPSHTCRHRRAKLTPGVVLEWSLHLQTRPVWVLGVWDKAMCQLPSAAHALYHLSWRRGQHWAFATAVCPWASRGSIASSWRELRSGKKEGEWHSWNVGKEMFYHGCHGNQEWTISTSMFYHVP